MIIGSGPWQLDLIDKAKNRGYYIINTNLHSDSPGALKSDAFFNVDIFDMEGQLKIAKQYNVDGVVCNQIDIAVPTVAYVAEKMGLAGIGFETAKLFTNKFLMREFCKENNFLIPRYFLCKSIEDAINGANEIKYPVVIKPINNRSSRGVHKVHNETELKIAFEDTKLNSFTDDFLIEEYIGGLELTVDGFKENLFHTTLGISEKSYYDTNEVLSYKLYYSRENLNKHGKLIDINNLLMEKTSLNFGITHSEYKLYKGNYYLIEFAARGGGANISSKIIPLISGIDVESRLLDLAMNEQSKEQIDREFQIRGSAALQFFIIEPGVIKKISGLEKISNFKNIIEADLQIKVGDVYGSPTCGAMRAGHFIAFEDNDLNLNLLIEKVLSTLKVEYE